MKTPVSMLLFIYLSYSLLAQETKLEKELNALRQTELVQSMSQRSLLIPSYHAQLKALVAKQAYNFWAGHEGEKLVSHKNVYSALYYASKYLEFDSAGQKTFNQAVGHHESVTAIIFGKDNDKFYSAGSDGKVLMWSLDNIDDIPEVIFKENVLIKSIDLSYDEKILLINTKENGIFFKYLDQTGEISKPVLIDPEVFQEVTFYPNEYKYLGVNKKGQIRIKGLNIDSTIIRKYNAQINDIKISEDAATVYLGSDAGQLEIIPEAELPLSKEIPELYAINAIAISHDQSLLAVGREKGDAILIDLKTNQILRTISGHQSAVTDVDFDPSDQLLLTASRDRTVRIWETHNSRKLPLIFDDHDDWVFTATFTPDGTQVVTGSKDKFIRLWPIDHKALADRLCANLTRNMSPEEWKEFVGSKIPYQETCPLSE